MKKLALIALLLLSVCGHTEQINPLSQPVEDYKLTGPRDCVYSTEIDPKGMYYNISGFFTDGTMATSEISCDDTYIQWRKLKPVKVIVYRT